MPDDVGAFIDPNDWDAGMVAASGRQKKLSQPSADNIAQDDFVAQKSGLISFHWARPCPWREGTVADWVG